MISRIVLLSVITDAWSPPYEPDRGPRPDYDPEDPPGCDDPTKYFKPWISTPNVIQMGKRTLSVIFFVKTANQL